MSKLSWQFYTGLALIAVGMGVAVMGTLNFNMVLMVLGVVVAGPGVYLCYRGWQNRHSYGGNISYKMARVKRNNGHNGQDAFYPNCLIIRPKSIDAEYIDPDYLEDPPMNAMVRKCHNGNRSFYLLEQNAPDEKLGLRDLELPDDNDDKISYNPLEFANVITMPLNKKYFEWSATIFQKIAIGLMVIVIIIEIIGLVVLGGSPEEVKGVINGGFYVG